MKSMSSREVSKAWTRNAPSATTGSSRRQTAIERVQKELQEDAQYDQVVRDPGVVRGDLLARAAGQVVGGLGGIDGQLNGGYPAQGLPEAQSGTGQIAFPTNLRPGSIVAAQEGQQQHAPSRSQNQNQPATLPATSQEAIQEAARKSFEATTTPQEAAGVSLADNDASTVSAPTRQTQRPLSLVREEETYSDNEDAERDESKGSAGTMASSDADSLSSEEADRHALGVVAEEDEDGGSSVGHRGEMTAAPRFSYLPQSPSARNKALDAALKRKDEHSPQRSGLAAPPLMPESPSSAKRHGSRAVSDAEPFSARSGSAERIGSEKDPRVSKDDSTGRYTSDNDGLLPNAQIASAESQPLANVPSAESKPDVVEASADANSDAKKVPSPDDEAEVSKPEPVAGVESSDGSVDDQETSHQEVTLANLTHPEEHADTTDRSADSGTASESRTEVAESRDQTDSVKASAPPATSISTKMTLTTPEEGETPPVPPKDFALSHPSSSTMGRSLSNDKPLSATTSVSSFVSAYDSEGEAKDQKPGIVTSAPDSGSSASSDDSDDDEGSGKDGEIGAREKDSSRVSFPKDKRGPSVGSDSDVRKESRAEHDHDSSSEDSGVAETATVGSTETGRRSVAQNSSRPPSTLRRRLSDMSMGNSFAFSHFMGSKMSGRSSSRRIKLDGDDVDDSDEDASEEDEELKKLALKEQERLRNISVGDDFFGGSLNDVLAEFDKMDFDGSKADKAALLSEKARAEGASQRETEDAQVAAHFIVSEVRRRRAAGETDVDHKTVRSEGGGTLATSFAALWLMDQAQDGQGESSEAAGTERERDSQPAARSRPLSNEMSISPSTTQASVYGSPMTTPEKPAKVHGIMDRPRHKVNKPKQMGGFAIARGHLDADAPKAPTDDRSTLPSLASFNASNKNAAAEPPQKQPQPRRSIDLGDQKRSKDKPAPTRSALKPKALKHSKSLADTLFSFSPTKRNDNKTETKKKRVRALSIGASKKGGDDRKSVVLESPRKTGSESGEPKSPDADSSMRSTSEASDRRVAEADGDDTADASEGSIVRPDPVARFEGDTRPGQSQHSTSPKVERNQAPVEASPNASASRSHAFHERKHVTSSKGKERARDDDIAPPREASKAVPSEEATRSAKRSTGSSYESGQPVDPSDQASPAESEIWSERSAVSTALTSPSHGAAPDAKPPQAGASAPSGQANGAPAPPASQSTSSLSMPPPPIFASSDKGAVQVEEEKNDDLTPLAKPHSLGINLIPPTPPAVSGDGQNKLLQRSASTSSHTPTSEHPPLVNGNESHAGVKRTSSSASKRSDGTLVRRPSRRKSATQTAGPEVAGLNLPAGMTATTIASSSSAQTKRKSVSAGEGRRHETPDSASPLPPSVPAKDLPEPSRVYAGSAAPSGTMPLRDHANTSLASLSPPPSTASSSAGSPERDVSPARSITSRTSSSAHSGVGAHGASNSAAMSDGGSEGYSQRARVRTQSLMPTSTSSRRPLAMAAIDEWASSSPSPVDGTISPSSAVARDDSPYAVLNSPSRALSVSSERSGESPAVVRNAPMGAPTEMYLPVPRSRMSVDDRMRQQWESGTASPSYARSLDGHGNGGLTRENSMMSVGAGGSVDGHSAQRRPSSFTSGASSMTDVQSLHSMSTVPHSTYKPARDPVKAAASSTVDDRLYQRSTMATISVTSGAFSKKTVRRKAGTEGADGAAGEHVPEHLQDELGQTSMSMTAHTPPPRKITSHQVLVQVIAVAIDEMDRMLLREKVRSGSAYGWVPGRSFCGRIMEVGWGVKRLRKGDVVFGLQSNRKSGALSEFMTVEQDLVAKAPEDCLTVEQIAALPAAGVLAHQIMQNYCANLPKGARILILNAHDGVGLLSLQECASLGPVIVAQCPATINDGVAVCEANGAHEVVVGDALWAMNTLHESSFDLVLDTIGGRRLYDAARRILATNGQYVTCFGDEHAAANPNFKSSMRSLRRTFWKKDKKNIGYEWIGVDSSEDCREALESVKAVAEAGDVCPRLRSVLPLADAPRAFDPVLRGAEEEPGAVVVRVS